MKTLLKKRHFLIFIIFISVLSCKKDQEPTPTPPPTTPTSTNVPNAISSFFNQNVTDATQSFTIDASTWQSINGTQGTSIWVAPNSFNDANGNVVNGNITIELIEVLTKADMIWLNKTTTSNNQLLISGGEISVKAYQNGNQLTLSSNGSLSVSIPDNNQGSMDLFLGTEDINGNINWDTTNVPVLDSSGYYDFFASSGLTLGDSLGWFNCDFFTNYSNKTDLNVVFPTNHLDSNTTCFIFFDNIYGVMPTYYSTINNQFIGTNVPVGEQVKIVAISELNGQLYSSITPITITANHTETITLTATTSSALQTDLNNL